jgi:hypothetical protein
MRYQSTFLACSEGKLFFVLRSRTIGNSQHSSYDYDNAFTSKLSSVMAAVEDAFINVNVAMQSLWELTGNPNLTHRQPCELG